ncbi:hypothetical protein C0992_005001 [Termitomyces sp. T32_za158]|nr:hypothetical protein C0992_005001 [Termitomyces sp. T32_za158]
MLQVKVERQAAQYCVALRRLVELQQERRAAQDNLLHAREVVDDMEDELARLRMLKGHGSSAPRLVPKGMCVLEDAEETHHRLSFVSRRTLEHVATNLGEDVPGLELAVQEQWWDMVRSLGVIEVEEAAAMEVDLMEEPEGPGEVVDLRTRAAVREGSSGGGTGMDLDG